MHLRIVIRSVPEALGIPRRRVPSTGPLSRLCSDDFTIHLTYPTDAFNVPEIGHKVQRFFDAERARGRKYRVATRAAEDLSVRVPLA